MVLLHKSTLTISHVSSQWFTKQSLLVHSLLLKPFSSITDENAIEASNILGNCSHLSDESKVVQFKELFESPSFYTKQTNIPAYKWLLVFDYLRSNGYAMPWMEITVEQMVEYGWVKLKD